VGPRNAPVQLYHNTISGERWLSIDGVEVPGTVGSHFGPLAGSSVLAFRIGEGEGDGSGSGRVTIATVDFSKIHYSCVFNDAPVPEDNAAAGAGSGAGAAAGADAAGAMRVSVEAVDMGADEKSGRVEVAWFRVRAVRESDRRETVVHRRFNNFVALQEAVRSAYQGSALAQSVPELPSRGFKFFEDQLAPAFLEKRRWALQSFLYKLELLPRVRQNTDFLTFVGLVDGGVRESSAIFPPGAPLGITLSAAADGFTEVTAIKPNADGSPSPAMAAGAIVRVGDKVSKVAGEDVIGQRYEMVVALLKAAKRPVVVHFLGVATAGAAAPAAEGADAAGGAAVGAFGASGSSSADGAGFAQAAEGGSGGLFSPPPAAMDMRSFVGDGGVGAPGGGSGALFAGSSGE
jgi:hypothetical protein